MKDLEGQVAIVTGAGQGVGAAIAERLAAAGAHLALVDRQENLVREVAGKIAEDHGHEARHYTCDVRDRAALADVIKDAATMTGRIDVLVNNAGRWISGPFVDSAPLDWEEQIDTNFGAVLTLTQLIVQRHQAGWPQAHIAAAMGVSRKCVKTWIDRYDDEGDAGLV
ncbi:SDR family NAD(P)-dependent oxidoreductase, partial [Nocardioides carbamazepini]|uniref:SDR family NAD(P)-dependent oxidoreductase n=1 Tax=Nocardioides carbamazepini TaxID=2854259 RepID=UPI00214A1C69